MRIICLGACLLLACRPAVRQSAQLRVPPPARTVFTDSTIFRAQCKEADSLKNLTAIPRKCTLRDQRLKIY